MPLAQPGRVRPGRHREQGALWAGEAAGEPAAGRAGGGIDGQDVIG